MNTFYLIGGTFNDLSLIIDDIKKEKEINSILFIDQANLSHEKNYLNFLNNYQNLTKNIKIIKEEDNLLEETKKADLIYLNGGRTELLYHYLNKNHFKELLDQINNKIFVGLSAGAIIFFNLGYGDKDVYYDNHSYFGFDFTKGFGYFNYIFCPHYQKEGILSFNQDVLKYHAKSFCLTDGALIKIKNNQYQIIKEKNAQAFLYQDEKLDALFPKIIYQL